LEKAKKWVDGIKAARKDPERAIESLEFKTKLKLRSMNNDIFAKKLESIFLPSNVIIMALLALTSYIFILSPTANPTFRTVLWFMVFSSWALVAIEYIRMNVDDPDKYNEMSLRVGLVGLIPPLMLMVTVGLPQILVFTVITFMMMLPMIYVIRSNWKISGHMCTYTAMSTIMAMINGWFAPLFLMIPVISWCRIKLKAHTAAQVFVGTLLGFVIPYTIAFLLPMV
jgi:membrane-associated phospholipid phosphatase